MAKTPGIVYPSSSISMKDLEEDVKRRDEAAGFTMFDPNDLSHSSKGVNVALTLEQNSEFIDDYLEHFGKKGMHWGVRNRAFRKGQRGDWRTRSGGQKVGLVTGALVGSNVGSYVAQRLMRGHVKTPTGLAVLGGLTLGASAGGAILGGRLTRNLLQKHGKKPMKQIRKLHNQPLSNDESIRRVQKFIDSENRRQRR